jgi:hypothetical protein
MRRKKPGDVADLVGALAHRPEPKQEPKRDRGWEERQRHDAETMQVSWRGIPRELNDWMKAQAQAHGLTVSEVARRLLEIGLEEVQSERRKLG